MNSIGEYPSGHLWLASQQAGLLHVFQLIETFVLFSVGAAAGLALAYAALRWFVITRGDMVRAESIGIDAVVVATVAGLVLICTLFAGLIPVLASRSGNLLAALQQSSRSSTAGSSRTCVRKVLVGAEVAFTVVLLVSAGLLLKSYMRLRSSDLGCATDNILTMHFTLPKVQYGKPVQRVAFFDDLLARVRALPGVDGAGLVRAVPGEGYVGDGKVTIAERPPLPLGHKLLAIVRWADPGYFASLKIPFLRGRTFGSDQRLDGANEAIISAEFARQYFPNEDPVGKHLIGFGRGSYEIVGVVGDTRYQLAEPPDPTMYFPIDAGTSSAAALVVRAARDPESIALPIQKVIEQMDRELAVSDVLTMNQLINQSSLDANFEATLLAVFAGISLLLAAVGLFGVLAYLATQRRTEIGIRLALGAQRETKHSFANECFASHKVSKHYQPAIANTVKGTPVVFLVVLDRVKGPANSRAISQVEAFLIQNAVVKNPYLSNIHGTKEEKWGIVGVIRGGKGKTPASVKAFRAAMGI